MHHFVDEAGDLTLFNRKKQVVLGRDGVSNYFMVGVAFVPQPDVLDEALTALRKELLSDPFLNRIPSFQPSRKKTAVAFHAKDDAPEVRLRVFNLLRSSDIKVFVGIRTKRVLVEQARAMHRYGQKISEHQIDDDLFSRLLRNRLHLADENHIVVSRRGTKDRKEALTTAIGLAQANFMARWGEREYGPCHVRTDQPSQCAGLQAVDYFLWALQRLYERREDRYFTPLSRHYRIIMDLDDARRQSYGEWYTDSSPLSVTKIMPVTG